MACCIRAGCLAHTMNPSGQVSGWGFGIWGSGFGQCGLQAAPKPKQSYRHDTRIVLRTPLVGECIYGSLLLVRVWVRCVFEILVAKS